MIGDGDQRKDIENQIKLKRLQNIFVFDYIPREEYIKLLDACDMGIVCLNSNMEVPSFPSKTLDYLKREMPILAMVDKTTDYLKILKDEKMGIGIEGYSDEAMDELVINLLEVVNDKKLKYQIGRNGNLFYKKNLTVKNAFSIISKHIENNSVS